MHDFRKLRVYELALEIAEETYRLTAMLPASEHWNLGSQMNRCAISIVSNIAEGAGRGDSRDFAVHPHRSGSASELDAQATLRRRLALIERSDLAPLQDKIQHIKASLTQLDRHFRPSPTS